MRKNIKYFLITVFIIAIYSINVHAADLVWNASTGDVSGYRIYYGTSQGNYPFNEDVGDVTQYDLSNLSLSEGSTYYFVVRAYNASGESGNSNVTSYSVPDPGDTTPPSSPQGVAGEIVNNTIVLTWQANSETDLSFYRVYYGTSSRWYGLPIPVNGTEYSITGLTNATYYLAVRAVDTSGNESGYSWPEIQKTIVSTIPDTTAPVVTINSPTTALTYDVDSNNLNISGTASDDTGVTVVFWSNSRGGSGTATGTSNWSVTDITLREGENVITVSARDQAGNTASDILTLVYTIPYIPPGSWIELTNDNFESGWGNFKDGGLYCKRVEEPSKSHQGQYSIKIRKNGNSKSSFFYRSGIDVKTPDYSQIKIEFWFLPVDMGWKDKLYVEYHDGNDWQTIAKYKIEENFTNGSFYHEGGLIINRGTNLIFPENMKIRFRCKSKKYKGKIFIDEVIVSAR